MQVVTSEDENDGYLPPVPTRNYEGDGDSSVAKETFVTKETVVTATVQKLSAENVALHTVATARGSSLTGKT